MALIDFNDQDNVHVTQKERINTRNEEPHDVFDGVTCSADDSQDINVMSLEEAEKRTIEAITKLYIENNGNMN